MARVRLDGPPEPEAPPAAESAAEPAQARPRFFYGRVIVAVMAVTGALTMCMGALVVGTTPPPGVPRSALNG